MIKLITLFFVLLSVSSIAQDNKWATYFELSGQKATPKCQETLDYCKRLEKNSKWIHLISFGKSSLNRVDLTQPNAKIIIHILDPKGNGSFLYWGFSDAFFEQKGYAESYKMEHPAKKMVTEDSFLKEEFDKKKPNDPVFARNPDAILNWVLSKTPYRDNRKDASPLEKISDRKVLDRLIIL